MAWQDQTSNRCILIMGESKRRLTVDQVRILEMNFDEEEGKLEQEKKMHLARVLGLEPRQIAVWFQNRRVRSKNKQLERNFVVLKQDYEILKTDYDNLIQENKKLKSEVHSLSCSMGASTSIENIKADSTSTNIVKEEIGEPSKVKEVVLQEDDQSHDCSQFYMESTTSDDSLWGTDYWKSQDIWKD
ncbi:hypothetical protein SUGI_0945820 [Cryptomeria japonica]|uniref:homeobox-leucine zipper protein HAT5 n=1 Tax=Cryptomeria japonica TaxID=3369 RepID=UPI0024149F6E|nr:homeobox-leucine zipper protein HAT5 [Cryptomeria japonica]GLJ44925.1 hypothetical protein SUGI_0945820 [Cryptomeria japonica]